LAVVGEDGRPPDLSERVHRGVQGNGPEKVCRTGFLAVRRDGPYHTRMRALAG
jgi:hypothetical protein